jgi:hypothetical protein
MPPPAAIVVAQDKPFHSLKNEPCSSVMRAGIARGKANKTNDTP